MLHFPFIASRGSDSDHAAGESGNVSADFRFHRVTVAFLLSLFCFSLPLPGQIPDAILTGLGSEDFAQRETSQNELETWVLSAGPDGLKSLLRQSKEHPDAEVRLRCLKALKEQVGRIYEGQGNGYLGILMDDKTVEIPGNEQKKIPSVLILEVMPDSAADHSGLEPGDCIISVAGKDFSELPQNQPATSALRQRVQGMKPTTTIEVEVLRGQQIKAFEVTLGRRPAALDELGFNRSLELVEELEKRQKEEHFRKWLLGHDDRR